MPETHSFLIGPPTDLSFELVDHHGRTVSDLTYRGHYMLVYFGFTHCRAVCPRALWRLSEALSLLDDLVDLIVPLYITVDPERDTPEVMKIYLEEMYPLFTGLTGSREEAEHAKRQFRVFAETKSDPTDPSGFTIPHSALSYLVGPEGRYIAHFADNIEAGALASRLKDLIGAGHPVR